MIQFLDALAIFFMISMGVIGFRRGVIEELGRLLGLIISMIFSLSFYLKTVGPFVMTTAPVLETLANPNGPSEKTTLSISLLKAVI